MAPDEPDRSTPAVTTAEPAAAGDAQPGDASSGSHAATEATGADLMRAKTSDELGEIVDPVMAAQLAAWFGLPSFTELEERGAKATEEDPDDKYWRELRAKVAEAVFPDMIERVASKVTSADRLLMVRELAPMTTEARILLHDEGFGEGIATAVEPRVLEMTDELRSDLNECAPQALLRDLYRPEADFCEPCTWREPYEVPRPDYGSEVREIMKLRFPMPPWIKPVAEYLEAVADLRAWVAKDWGSLPIPRPEGD